MIFITRLAKNVNKFILFLWRSLEKQQYTRPRKKRHCSDILQSDPKKSNLVFYLVIVAEYVCYLQSNFCVHIWNQQTNQFKTFLNFFPFRLDRQQVVLTCSSTSNGLVFQKVKLGQWVPFHKKFRFLHSSTSVCCTKKVI